MKDSYVVIYDEPSEHHPDDVVESYYGYFSSTDEAVTRFEALGLEGVSNVYVCKIVREIE